MRARDTVFGSFQCLWRGGGYGGGGYGGGGYGGGGYGGGGYGSQRSQVHEDSTHARSSPPIPHVWLWRVRGRSGSSSCAGSSKCLGNAYKPEFCKTLVLKNVLPDASHCYPPVNHCRTRTLDVVIQVAVQTSESSYYMWLLTVPRLQTNHPSYFYHRQNWKNRCFQVNPQNLGRKKWCFMDVLVLREICGFTGMAYWLTPLLLCKLSVLWEMALLTYSQKM
ncbi:uncharacterized protein LOC132869045 [Neoarius graeffei]|uniref:uncharacterized protein LOC132869045 n=1 Tax=Neoarius graeffei TaxID=443677 RepID=UPI00298C4681|nr:uncharacterized protein LOC132869045 [Neoarius graeffei]